MGLGWSFLESWDEEWRFFAIDKIFFAEAGREFGFFKEVMVGGAKERGKDGADDAVSKRVEHCA